MEAPARGNVPHYDVIALPFPVARSINNNGMVVGDSGSTLQGQLFIWSANAPLVVTGMSDATTPSDINDAGDVVGTAYSFDSNSNQIAHGFLYRNGGFTDFGLNVRASAITNSGVVVGSVPTSSGPRAAILAPTLAAFGEEVTPGFWSGASGINNSGQILGLSEFNPLLLRQAWVYDNGALTTIQPFEGGRDVFPSSINDAGQVVGYGDINRQWHAFLWTQGGTRDLGSLLNSGSSFAASINKNGHVVGVSSVSSSQSHAFLYTGNGPMRDLNNLIDPSSGWTLGNATAINDRGQIVGYTDAGGGFFRAFLLNPIGVHWSAASGNWSNDDNWNTGQTPTAQKDTYIDPAGDADVEGPAAPTTVKSLTIGDGNARHRLNLRANGPVTVTNNLTINRNGVLSGGGTITAASVISSGEISPAVTSSSAPTPGLLNINSSLEQRTGGSLLFRVYDTASNDAVSVSGSASLRGDLKVRIAGETGYRPRNTESFTVVSTGAILSTNFSNLSGNNVEALFESNSAKAGLFKVVRTDNALTLTGFHQIHVLSVGVNDPIPPEPQPGEPAPKPPLLGQVAATAVNTAFSNLPGVATNELLPLYLNTDGNNLDLEQSISNVAAKVRPGDTFVLYISSHGTFDPSEGADDGETPLFRQVGGTTQHPILFKRNNVETTTTTQSQIVLSADDLQHITATIKPMELQRLFDREEWRDVNKLFVLDSCWAGGFWSDPSGDPLFGDPELEYLSRLPHSAILASADEGRISIYDGNTGASRMGVAFAQVLSNLQGEELDFATLERKLRSTQENLFAEQNGYAQDLYTEHWGESIAGPIPVNLMGASTADFNLGLVGTPLEVEVPEPCAVAAIALATLTLLRRGRV